MKKTITKLLAIFGITCACAAHAQVTETFETYTLSTLGYYKDTLSTSWQDAQSVFRYSWDTTYKYWSGGSAYTNLNDATNGNSSHIYNCKAGKGYNNSNVYVTAQPGGIIKLKNPYNIVQGFYVTNTTYDYNSMKNGDSFAKKFGGTTGNDPDWFKLLVFGYRAGALTTDSVEFYLADYRFTNNAQDYIVQNWQWVDCTILGAVDSLTFKLKSTDVGSFGMNTPAFFSYDNFTTAVTVGIHELSGASSFKVFPNPAADVVYLQYNSPEEKNMTVNVYDLMGALVSSSSHNAAAGMNTQAIETANLKAGVYFIEISSGAEAKRVKLIRQ